MRAHGRAEDALGLALAGKQIGLGQAEQELGHVVCQKWDTALNRPTHRVAVAVPQKRKARPFTRQCIANAARANVAREPQMHIKIAVKPAWKICPICRTWIRCFQNLGVCIRCAWTQSRLDQRRTLP